MKTIKKQTVGFFLLVNLILLMFNANAQVNTCGAPDLLLSQQQNISVMGWTGLGCATTTLKFFGINQSSPNYITDILSPNLFVGDGVNVRDGGANSVGYSIGGTGSRTRIRCA